MKYNKHIIFFCPAFPHNEDETDCIPAMQNFIKGFHQHHPEIRISVVSFYYPFIKSDYVWHDINVYALGKKGLNSLKIIKWGKVYTTFKRIYNPKEDTIIQSFWLHDCALVGQMISYSFNVKHYCMVMGQDASLKNKYRYILPSKKLVIFCPNELSNQKLMTVFGRKANYIIPRGIDEGSFRNIPKSEKNIDVLGVGNISELKNYSSFLRIIKHLKEKISVINVVIIGKGEEEEKMKTFILENNLDMTVSIVGHLKREDVLKTMSRSKILLHTSTFEDESYAITEALYAGMYAVGYKKVHNERENLHLGKNEEDLTNICQSILTAYQPPKKTTIHTIKQMVKDFYEVYFP
jgi:glycosyltransferase involved in cell wall biosynthesis